MKDLRIEQLVETRRRNNRAAGLLAAYLNETPCAITPDLMGEACAVGDDLSQELFYKLLLGNICGLDMETSAEDEALFHDYFIRGIHRLDVDAYRTDPYYAQVVVPEAHGGEWKLAWTHYAPYEAFVCRDLTLTESFVEIPHIGYFDREFRFPLVQQGGREWMAIKPNEIETMREPVRAVSGRVVTLGLGMGYFAYMASEKPDVEQVTVVERDERVVALFRRYILPRFNHPEKVKIVTGDALAYVREVLPMRSFDFLFADLWHDAADGLPLYLQLKRCEKLAAQTQFLYWVEETLLSHLRWQVFDAVIATSTNGEQAERRLSDASLRLLASGAISIG